MSAVHVSISLFQVVQHNSRPVSKFHPTVQWWRVRFWLRRSCLCLHVPPCLHGLSQGTPLSSHIRKTCTAGLMEHSKLPLRVIVSTNGWLSMCALLFASNQARVDLTSCPKTARIGSSMPAALVRTSAFENGWMGGWMFQGT